MPYMRPLGLHPGLVAGGAGQLAGEIRSTVTETCCRWIQRHQVPPTSATCAMSLELSIKIAATSIRNAAA
eukprot:scaffold26563_cov30-Prasinocladus_malaysianus.AAC.1